MSKHFHLPKTQISMTDVWILLTIALFTFFVDIIYVGVHFFLGIQISDYWLVVNVVFYAIELVALTSVNIAKKINPSQKETYKEIAREVGKGAAAGVVGVISDNMTLPDLTSGERSDKKDEDEEETAPDYDDSEEEEVDENEPVG